MADIKGYSCYGLNHSKISRGGYVMRMETIARGLAQDLRYLCIDCLGEAIDNGKLVLSLPAPAAAATNGDHQISVDVTTTDEGSILVDDTEYSWGSPDA